MSVGNTICWADIPVVDLDRAIRFYSAMLGQPVRKEAMEGFAFGLLPHSDSNVSGCLAVLPDSQPSATGPLLYFSVDGRFDEALEAARQEGGTVLMERHAIGPHGFRAVLLDSEGNRIALHENPR